MYALEYKQLFIIREPMLKNCCTQTYRWKQAAVCESAEPLERLRASKSKPNVWRVVPMGDSATVPKEIK